MADAHDEAVFVRHGARHFGRCRPREEGCNEPLELIEVALDLDDGIEIVMGLEGIVGCIAGSGAGIVISISGVPRQPGFVDALQDVLKDYAELDTLVVESQSQ